MSRWTIAAVAISYLCVLFAVARSHLLRQQVHATRRWRRFTGQKYKAARKIVLPRPLHQYAHGRGFGAFAVTVQHQYDGGLQPFGTVYREQLHRIGCSHLRHGIATGAQGTHKAIGRQKPPAVH